MISISSCGWSELPKENILRYDIQLMSIYGLSLAPSVSKYRCLFRSLRTFTRAIIWRRTAVTAWILPPRKLCSIVSCTNSHTLDSENCNLISDLPPDMTGMTRVGEKYGRCNTALNVFGPSVRPSVRNVFVEIAEKWTFSDSKWFRHCWTRKKEGREEGGTRRVKKWKSC